MSQPVNSLIGQQVAGFKLTALLGVGGMAKVYRAQDVALGREVAVKLVSGPQASDEEYVQHFRAEAKRIAALNHPNIVPIYHFGEDRGSLFLVMPVLAESLRQRLDREHILPFEQAVQIVTQIAAALHAAHAQGIVHRDVKPENVLLDRDGSALLTDFGIAREVEVLRRTGAKRTLSPSGLPVGTPEYMAPEQLQAQIVDHRADIYALGAVLYEAITGTTPHAAASPYAVAVRVLTEPLTPPSQHNPQIPSGLEQVVLRALSQNPEDRYPDMASFAEALIPASSTFSLSNTSVSTSSARRAREASSAGLTSDYVIGPSRRTRFHYLRKLQRSAIQAMLGRNSQADIDQYSKFRRYRWRVAAVLAAVLVLGGADLLLMSHQPSPSSQAASLGHLPTAASTSSAGSNATAPPTVSRTTPPQPTSTVRGTATPKAHATPTVSPATSTPTTSAVSLQLNPATQVTLSKQAQSCTGSQVIMNANAFSVSWQWASSSPNLTNLQFQTGGSGWTSGLPFGTLAGNSSTTLSIRLACGGNQYNAVTMTDDEGNTYTFSLQLA